MDEVKLRKSAKNAEPERDEHGIPYITHDYLMRLCESQGQFRTPHLNDRLYLAHKGFGRIQALEEYANIKALYMNENVIKKIENIGHLKFVRSLFLQNNQIGHIEGLDGLDALETLNLSHNNISKIENLEALPLLSNLDLSDNKIIDSSGIGRLSLNLNLTTLNLTGNMISDNEEKLIQDLKELKSLKVLYLKQNPVISRIKNYRKRMLFELRALTYLDDRPVAPNERRLATSFILKGAEGETEERETIRQESQTQHKAYLDEINEARERARQKGLSELMSTKKRCEDEIGQNELKRAELARQITADEQLLYERSTVGELSLEENERIADSIRLKRIQIEILKKEVTYDKLQMGNYDQAIQHASDPHSFAQEAPTYIRSTEALLENQGERPLVLPTPITEMSTEPEMNSRADTQSNISVSARNQVQVNPDDASRTSPQKENEKNTISALARREIERVLEETMFDFAKSAEILKEIYPQYFKIEFDAMELGKLWANVEKITKTCSTIENLEDLD
jgi:dynein assembly factor 1